jgi:hypothetical protein
MASDELKVAVTLTGAELAAAKLDAVEKALTDNQKKVQGLGAEWGKTLPKMEAAGRGFGGISAKTKNAGRELGMMVNVVGESAYMAGNAIPAFRNLGMTMVMAGGNAVTLGASFGPWGVAIAGVTAALPILVEMLGDTDTQAEATKKSVADLAAELDTLAKKSLEVQRVQGLRNRAQSGDLGFTEAQEEVERQRIIVTRAVDRLNAELRVAGRTDLASRLQSGARSMADPYSVIRADVQRDMDPEALDRVVDAYKAISREQAELVRLRGVKDESLGLQTEEAVDVALEQQDELTRRREAEAKGEGDRRQKEREREREAALRLLIQQEDDRKQRDARVIAHEQKMRAQQAQDEERARQTALREAEQVERMQERATSQRIDTLVNEKDYAAARLEIERQLMDVYAEQAALRDAGVTATRNENQLRMEQMELEQDAHHLQQQFREVTSKANDEQRQQEEDAIKSYLAATSQAADIASMSTKLVLGETKEALAIESLIRAAQEGAEAVSSLASYDYWGFAQHLLAASLHGVAAAKAGSAGGTPSRASGGGSSAPSRPTNERETTPDRGGSSTTIIFQSAVSEAEVGRLTYRAQRAADRRYGRSAS